MARRGTLALGRHLARRRLLQLGVLTAAAASLTTEAWSSTSTTAAPRFSEYPFSLGVASGDPAPDGMVLWTRLAPEPLAEDGLGGMPNRPVPVQFEVAEDDNFRRVVRRGTVVARPELAHSVHVELHGLRPGREYFYRFRVGRVESPVGRTRTLPPTGAPVGMLTLAFASCQRWSEGFYTAYRHMAEEDVDLVFHLGDYIYEDPINPTSNARQQTVPDYFQVEAITLPRYRTQYALYKMDPDLQAAHAAHPWVVTIDDHDVDDSWAADVPKENSPTPTREEWLARRAAAFQAFYEHQPVRLVSKPSGPDMQLYRRFAYGDLAEFSVLDTRQFRSDQACGDGRVIGCEDRLDPTRTMLGEEQERWLLEGLARSRAQWNVLAQQVFFCQRDFEEGPEQRFGMDEWSGYEPARARVIEGFRRTSNPVVLTGDVHVHAAAEVKSDFNDPTSETLAVEFATTSISSGGDGADVTPATLIRLKENPHLKFENQQRGYAVCTVTRRSWRTDFKILPYVVTPGAPISVRASYVTEAGRPGLQEA